MSMNCKQAEEYLVEYLYQELSPKKTLEIEKHLHSCSQCAKTLESWRAIHRGYQRSTDEPQIEPYFKQKMLAAAEEELRRGSSWKERLLFGLKIATVPIAIFLIVILLNQKEKEPHIAMQNEKQVEPVAAKPAPEATAPAVESPQRQKADTDELKRKDVPASRNEQYSLDKLKAAPQSVAEEKTFRDREEGAAKKEEYEQQIAPASPPPPGVAQNEPAAAGGMQPSGQELAQQRSVMKSAEITPVAKTNPNAPFWQGQTKLQQNDLRAGVKDLQKAITEDDSKSLASQFHETGNAYQSKGDYKNAIIQFRLLQSNYQNYPYMDDVLLRLGDSYAEIGQFGEAVKAYNQVSPAQQKLAQERIHQLEKKREAQEQLKALGYVGDTNKQ
jgi:tetratricopeptide (TPR) repeat protein